MVKNIVVSEDVWGTLYNLKVATKAKTINDVLIKLLHKELYEGLKLEEVEEP